MKFYGIYKITNLLNGKMYIGKHITSNLDDNYMGSGLIIARSIDKHGKENFRKEWLMFCEDADELNYMERVFVDQNWVDRSDTYNLKIGGDGGWDYINENGIVSYGMKGKHHSKEAKEKISNTHKGKLNGMFGVSSPFKGKHCSKETLHKLKVPIDAYSLDGKLIGHYNSMKEAASATGASYSKICEVCRGTRHYANKIIFKYALGKGQFRKQK